MSRHPARPGLGGAWNFRDVAETADTVRPGRLLRSSELSRLDDAGRAELSRLGVTDIADLRSPREVTRRGPGRVPDHISIHSLPFPDLAAEPETDGGSPHEDAFRRLMTEKPDGQSIPQVAARFMTEEYQRFPTLAGSRRAVHRVISLLAAGRPVLTHCFAGKDRTGFVVSVVLEALGVDRGVITADYQRSTDAAPALRAQIMAMLRQRSEVEVTPEVLTFTEARLSDEVLGVRPEYLAAARQSIDEHYGSLGGYLDAAGITDTALRQLRAELLG